MMRGVVQWPCVAAHSEGITLALKVSPNAARTGAHGLWQDRLRVRIKAPPVEGKANEALRKWVAGTFGLRRKDVEIISGEKASKKLLLLRGARHEAACKVLDSLGISSGDAIGPAGNVK